MAARSLVELELIAKLTLPPGQRLVTACRPSRCSAVSTMSDSNSCLPSWVNPGLVFSKSGAGGSGRGSGVGPAVVHCLSGLRSTLTTSRFCGRTFCGLPAVTASRACISKTFMALLVLTRDVGTPNALSPAVASFMPAPALSVMSPPLPDHPLCRPTHPVGPPPLSEVQLRTAFHAQVVGDIGENHDQSAVPLQKRQTERAVASWAFLGEMSQCHIAT